MSSNSENRDKLIADYINGAQPHKGMIEPGAAHICSILDGVDEDNKRRQETLDNIQKTTDELHNRKP